MRKLLFFYENIPQPLVFVIGASLCLVGRIFRDYKYLTKSISSKAPKGLASAAFRTLTLVCFLLSSYLTLCGLCGSLRLCVKSVFNSLE